jgi:uncharacterized protein (DUF488 family)
MGGEADGSVIYTVGHSNRPLPEFVGLLTDAAVSELVDVRSIPRSRRNPHFDGAALARTLPAHGIRYAHEPSLGGFRRPHPGSPNRGWGQQAFQGYADHMASEEFQAALARVAARAREGVACVMCAEAQWWRCHRRLLADALLVGGWGVWHLGLGGDPIAHALTPFAVLGEARALTYPAAQTELGLEA